jgi:hypothetical protein
MNKLNKSGLFLVFILEERITMRKDFIDNFFINGSINIEIANKNNINHRCPGVNPPS